MAQHALNQSPASPQVDGGDASGVLWAPVSTKVLTRGDRRLEASTFLTDGYGMREGLEAVDSTVTMAAMAQVWQPGRLKGFQVDPGKGLPFLSAGQVFESQPRVRKWLAEAMVPAVSTRYLESDWLLMSCSGEVGRVTAVYDEHLHKVITHDLLRVVPRDADDYGWLYAYMKTRTFYSIARSSQYGHMIKHLEPEHVMRMPVAMPDVGIRERIGADAASAIKMRQDSRAVQQQADALYATLVNPEGMPRQDTPFSTVSVTSVLAGRRRLEGQYHRADVLQVEALVDNAGIGTQPLSDLVKSVTMSNRFKRYFGANGTPYRSANELFDVNPRVTKRIYAGLLKHPENYMLRAGEMVMARSGQTYGLLGRTLVLNENHVGTFGSEDLIRIVPNEDVARTGYLQTVLNHVDYGRPRVVRYASGTSVPHLDPPDVREIPIPRFDAAREGEIADLADEANRLSAKADRLETAAVEAAEAAVARLTGRHGSLSLISSDSD